MSRKFTWFIFGGMILGAILGAVLNTSLPHAAAVETAGYFSVVTNIFLRLIRMIIAPLVFSTLISGIAHMGDGAAIGRVGGKTMAWFLAATMVSLLIGVLMANLLHLGSSLHLPLPPVDAAAGVQATLSLKDFFDHVFPASVVDAMARNEILQIVVFSLFAGIAIAATREKVQGLLSLLEQVSTVMLKITGYVMLFAPAAVFAALTATVATEGLGILKTYAAFLGSFYLSLGMLWAVLVLAGVAVVGPRLLNLLRLVRQPTLLAFSTASSEAAYPRTLEALETFGVSNRVASFVLPLGYSFNLDGSSMYTTFATLFIAQAYGIHLGAGQQALMVLMLVLTSKGIAGVPRASLVVIAATLTSFNIPAAGLLLILGIDHFLDMGRSATNVVGNSIAAAAVAKWEGQLRAEGEDAPILLEAEAARSR
ncbi:MAG TPA: dicarboxylate/amino acid:cation symporter [Caulobacteraceae bacterium]|jgi:Na+/H+-dicarboxylate symporter|nr:dicarboxylate/amino acid:cation symporter [Caulobacteraceae bacterium]